MAITRIWQAGAELQHLNELEESTAYGASSFGAISNTKARTGNYSFRFTGSTYSRGKSFASTTQIRAGAYLNHNGLLGYTTTYVSVIFYIESTIDILVQWKGDTNSLELVVNGTLQDSVSSSTNGFSTTNSWKHVGITCKSDASTGFVSFYVDGSKLLTYSGNTGTGITGAYISGDNSAGGWSNYAYFDDFYVDDTVGESDVAPASPRFPFLLANAAGTHTNWTPSASTNISNVDDSGAPDDDSTYNYATAATVKDSFNLTDTTPGVTVPSGYSIAAVIPAAWARKTDSGVASTLQLGTRLSTNESIGSAQTLLTSYGPTMERQTTKPGGGSWTESDIDSAEIILQSAGSYS